MSRGGLFGLLSLASSPAFRLTKVSINIYGIDEPDINQGALTNIFSSSPLTEASLQRNSYSSLSINVVNLLKFRIYSYDPGELLRVTMLHQAHHLIEFVVTMDRAPRHLFANISPITYVQTHLQRLSFVVTLENTRGCRKIPLMFDHVSLTALRRFDLLAQEDQGLYGILFATFEPDEYSDVVDLFRRSECSLTIVTLRVSVSVEAFLVAILGPSPALQKSST
ncbi:hypothetical protein IW262DRAFT_1459440 [Armillaria fumosa]|nr:hypothetical protein IW262DRAFT_1459440 [Armillaria fumosa]